MFPLITVSKPPDCFCQIFAKRHHEACCDDENDFFPSLHLFHKIKKQSGQNWQDDQCKPNVNGEDIWIWPSRKYVPLLSCKIKIQISSNP
jgi:hypothetical protein